MLVKARGSINYGTLSTNVSYTVSHYLVNYTT